LYMAPEQGRAENVDCRSDMYSLGCAFYHLVTGRPPFTSPSPVGVIMKHVTDRAVPVRTIAPEVPPAVERIIERMMAKDPAARHPTYDALLDALLAARPAEQSLSAFSSRGMAVGIDLVLFVVLAGFFGPLALFGLPLYFILLHRFFGLTVGKWL